MEELLIEIDAQGDTKITVKGVAGPSCKSLTAGIEKALGVVTSDKPTPEMRETGREVHSLLRRG